MMPKVPFPRSYWVVPGLFLAGAFPGSRDPDKTIPIMENLLQCGIRQIINLMEETELDYSGTPFFPYQDMYYRLAGNMGLDVRWVRSRSGISRFHHLKPWAPYWMSLMSPSPKTARSTFIAGAESVAPEQ